MTTLYKYTHGEKKYFQAFLNESKLFFCVCGFFVCLYFLYQGKLLQSSFPKMYKTYYNREKFSSRYGMKDALIRFRLGISSLCCHKIIMS